MGLWPSSPTKLTQPRWGWPLAGAFLRVARGSQPWAGGHIPLGLRLSRSVSPGSAFDVRRSAFDVRAFPLELSVTLAGANVTIAWPLNLCQTRLDVETRRNAEQITSLRLSASLCASALNQCFTYLA